MKMLHIYAIKLIFGGQKYEYASYLCNKVDMWLRLWLRLWLWLWLRLWLRVDILMSKV